MTSSQRLSLTSLVLPFLPVGATPDGSPGSGWRAVVAWGYSLAAIDPTDDDAIYLRGSVDAAISIGGSTGAALSMRGSTDSTITLSGSL